MNFFSVYIILFFLLWSCGDEGSNVEDKITPKNLQITVQIEGATNQNPYGDGSGIVNFKATAQDVVSFKYIYNGEEFAVSNGMKSFIFEKPGINTYSIKIVAIGVGGASISKMETVEVKRMFDPPAELIELLTGGSSKNWRIKSEAAGHMGVGPANAETAEWWTAGAWDKAHTAMYDDNYTFSIDQSFIHDTNGAIYGLANILISDLGPSNELINSDDEIENYHYDAYNETWEYSESDGKETITISNKGFFGFYVGGTHSFTILSRSNNEMLLRTLGDDENSWFFILTTEERPEIPADPVFTNLVWSDEFDINGLPEDSKWDYDIGTGSNGWGNNELQYYTKRTENVIVEDGVLKIIAKKENYGGSSYTSTRLKTQGKYDFKYGRIDVKAKLPGGDGTWPAIWMLGSNIETVGWPACGEIDIMEYSGYNPGRVQSAIHNNSSYGATVNYRVKTLENETTEYHIYSMIWSEDQISFLIDDERFYTYKPVSKYDANWPFDKNQFLLLNVAMGGTLGGEIDPNFTSSTMEIDYVRIYQ